LIKNQASTSSRKYIGDELELFEHAYNWKSYIRSKLSPYIFGTVAEVGAGIGATTTNLAFGQNVHEWLCIEPDNTQCIKIADMRVAGSIPAHCTVWNGVLHELHPEQRFDTIIYIDVLEHIEDDRAEFASAAQRLVSGGMLVVLGPAYNFLYSDFDSAVGHYRRYTRSSLRRINEGQLIEIDSFYLDSFGLLASLANKIFLRQKLPTESQIQTWDKYLVPLSRRLDPFVLRAFGRSAVCVWKKK
jgi:SAM-dependent methyltransferase